jgi:hypothetical protein
MLGDLAARRVTVSSLRAGLTFEELVLGYWSAGSPQ